MDRGPASSTWTQRLVSQRRSCAARPATGRQAHRTWRRFGFGFIAVSLLLAACAPDARQVAQTQKARLDKELQTARTSFGVPDGLLQPIKTQEQTIAAGTATGSDKTYSHAAARYTQLYHQVVAIEKMTPDQAHAQTSADLQELDAVIQELKKQDFALKAAHYQAQLQQAQQQFAAAQTTKNYFQVDGFVWALRAAVAQVAPVYQQITQTLQSLVDVQDETLGVKDLKPHPLQCALETNESFWMDNPRVTVSPRQPAPKYAYQDWHAQDLSRFNTANTAEEYAALAAVLRGQIKQLTAEAAALLPMRASRLVDAFQSDVQAYQQNGGTETTYQQQLEQDKQALAAKPKAKGYAALVQTVVQQRQAAALPFIQTQTQHDLKTLKSLIARGQASKTHDPYNGQDYPNAYEYADHNAFQSNFRVGIQDAEDRLAQAQVVNDYRLVDQEVQMFNANLSAMLRNLADHTPSTKRHQADLDLMNYYGIASGDNIIVSLREQKARIYANGKLLKAFDVTTGSPDKPTPPGIHCVLSKTAPDLYRSSDPVGSPLYFRPTPVHFSMRYSEYGFFVHDGWWRDGSLMGRYSNLPHFDPLAFNSGSHGCINFHYRNGDMGWLYNWAQVGTPVIVY